jgi:hypothetical protein
MKIVCSFVVSVIFIAGCASTTDLAKPEITNMTPAALLIDPVQITYLEYSSPFYSQKTFSVFPYSVINKTEKRDIDLDRQLLFCLRNFMELAGYKFVRLDQRPDFLYTVDTRSFPPGNYREGEQLFFNSWRVWNKLTWPDSSRTNSPATAILDWQEWGEWNPPLKDGEVPGYMDPKNYTVLPVDGHGYYHLVNIQAYDGRNMRNVWMATAFAASRTGNLRIAGQSIIKSIADCFFRRPIPDKPHKTGYAGITPSILTVDGKDYYPVVLGVYDKGPAAKAGVKQYDMIVAVDGVDMRNMTVINAMDLIKGEPGSKVELAVWRVNKLLKFTITRALLSSFNH